MQYTILQALIASALLASNAFAVGPSAGDLSAFTPDMTTVLTAVGAVGGVVFGKDLAIRGFVWLKSLINK